MGLRLSNSEVVERALEELPPDPTNLEDTIHAALFSGKTSKALEFAAQHDPWLSAHLADIMEVIELLDSDVDDE